MKRLLLQIGAAIIGEIAQYIADPDKFWGIEEHPTLEDQKPSDEKKWDCSHCGTRL